MMDTTVIDLQSEVARINALLEKQNNLDRLKGNRDFKQMIQEELLVKRALELTKALSKASRDSEEYIEIIREIDAISYLDNYINGKDASSLKEELMTAHEELELYQEELRNE